jgi:hypothetical protein
VYLVTSELGLHPVVGFDTSDQPVVSLQWLVDHRPHARLFHSLNFGSFLVYAGFPERGVLIDGRTSSLYPESFARWYYSAVEDPAVFRSWAAEAGFDAVLLHRRHRGTTALRDALTIDPAWQVAWDDQVAIVFVRK